MTRPLPKLRRHATGQAMVRIRGHDYYLGRHGTDQATQRYQRLIAQYQAQHLPQRFEPMTVGEMVQRFLSRARRLHGRDRGEHSQADNYRLALEPVVELFGALELERFGVHDLDTVREAMVAGGRLSYRTINARLGRIRAAFRWARLRGWYAPEALGDLATLPPLKPGQARKPPRPPMEPLPRAQLEAVLPHLPVRIAEAAELQYLAGMRPGEVVTMRADQVELDALEAGEAPLEYDGRSLHLTGDPVTSSVTVGVYRPPHKTEHHGLLRRILLGDRARAIVRRRWPADGAGRLFDQLTVPAYRAAIRRACQAAGVKPWGPNRLRHSAATEAYRSLGLSAAQELLDHANQRTTETYVHRDTKVHALAWVAAQG